MKAKHTKSPIEIGDRVVVANHYGIDVRVKNIVSGKGVVKLILDWGIHGTSRVFSHDEASTWYRYGSSAQHNQHLNRTPTVNLDKSILSEATRQASSTNRMAD